MSLLRTIERTAKAAKEASRALSRASARKKNAALSAMARELLRDTGRIMAANRKDLRLAAACGLPKAMVERLTLTEARIAEMARSVRALASLADPCGSVDRRWRRPNGLLISRVRVPIGVIGIIYESRPNVTADCAALCLKSGNAVVLKGGREAACSNAAIYTALRRGIAGAGLPVACVSMIDPEDRKAVGYLLKMDRYLDLVIPRGGEGLIRAVVENSRVPVIKHYKGVCHVYVDGKADIGKAVRICVNAKVQRPGVCNAMEALLVDRRIARRFLPVIVGEMRANGVEIRGCRATRAIVPGTKPAKASDFGQEFLDLVLAVRVVDGVGGAAAHIAEYGSGHSDAIVTEDRSASRRFLAEVDSACVYSNASTRFTDGCQFGFGAEIGISTDKIHARGPMALEELTSYKYVVTGNGQIRD